MPTDSKIDNTHLYAAMRLTPNGYWEGRSGVTDLKATATCFLIGDGRIPRNPGFLVTNKHVLAPPAEEKRGLCRIESITIDGFSQKPYTFGERGAVEAFSFTVRCPERDLA